MLEKPKPLNSSDSEGTQVVQELETANRKLQNMSGDSRTTDSPIKFGPDEMEDSQDMLNDPVSEADVDDDDHFEEGDETSVKDEPKNENITQVISADYTISSDSTAKNNEVDELKVSENKSSDAEKSKVNYMWVSNITTSTKASDLKKYFSQIGKVNTAKILTNGKSFYGYVSVENSEIATLCIKQLHNSLLDGNKISVSKFRPDLKENNKRKRDLKKKRNEKTDKKIVKDAPKLESAIETTNSVIKLSEDDKNRQAIDNLNRKLREAYSDIARYKRKFEECQRRFDSARRRCDSLEKMLTNLQMDNRAERRKLNREREDFEKTKKMEEIRFEADKAVVNKELAEVRKLRAHLKEKIEEFKNSTAKLTKRARSPVLRNVRSPVHRRTPPDQNRYDFENRTEKRPKREEMLRGRTPPPPPPVKLVEVPKKRTSETHSGSRHYFSHPDKKHVPSHPYDYRHKPGFIPPQQSPRTTMQVMYPKEVRRANPFPLLSQPYNEPKYGGGYPHQSNNVPLTPRNVQGHYYSTY